MSKELDSLLWWIPFKKVREKIRHIYYDNQNQINFLKKKIEDLEKNNIALLNKISNLSKSNTEKNVLFDKRVKYLESHDKIFTQDKSFKDKFFRYTLYNSNIPHKQKRWFIEYQVSKWLGYFINLDNPKTFNEKINWTKLYYRNPDMTIVADKYQFKNYIKEKLGDGYTIPLLGVWDNVNDIDFDSLPNQFVLKSNTGANSEEMIIVKDKSKLNIYEAKMKMNEWLQPWNNIAYKVTYHWDSVDISQKIIAEEYIEEIEKGKTDYSFYCSFGNVIFILVDYYKMDSKKNQTSFFDINWNKLDVKRPNLDELDSFNKPSVELSDKMFNLSKIISKDFPIVRVDFYNLKDKLLLGELTFYPAGGHSKFEPKEWDYKFGEMVDLNKIPREHLSKEWIDILETRPDQTRPDQTRPNM